MINEGDPLAIFEQGMAIQDVEKRIEFFKSMIDQQSNIVYGYAGLINAYLDLDDVFRMLKTCKEARKNLDSIRKKGKADATLLKVLANACQYLGDDKHALSYWKDAVSLQPTDPNYHANLADAYATLKMYDEAAQECRRALELKPDYVYAGRALAHIYLLEDQPQKSFETVEKYLSIAPRSIHLLLVKTAVLIALDRAKQALEISYQAAQLDPEEARVWIQMGLCLTLTGQHDEVNGAIERSQMAKKDTQRLINRQIQTSPIEFKIKEEVYNEPIPAAALHPGWSVDRWVFIDNLFKHQEKIREDIQKGIDWKSIDSELKTMFASAASRISYSTDPPYTLVTYNKTKDPRDHPRADIGAKSKAWEIFKQDEYKHPEKLPSLYEEAIVQDKQRSDMLMAKLEEFTKCPDCGSKEHSVVEDKSIVTGKDLLRGTTIYSSYNVCKKCGRKYSNGEANTPVRPARDVTCPRCGGKSVETLVTEEPTGRFMRACTHCKIMF